MAANNSEVSKVKFSFDMARCYTTERTLHSINHGGRSWQFAVYCSFPESGDGNPVYLSFTASPTPSTQYRRNYQVLHAKLEILNLRGIAIFTCIGKWSLNSEVTWKEFCSLSYLFGNSNELAPVGFCKMILSVGPLKYLTPAYPDVVALRVPGDESLVEFMKSMLNEGILTDVVIKTSTKTFPCHKAVLAASSEVFKAMFRVEMTENTDNEVKLDGVFEEATIEDLLYYLYTKETPPNIGETCSTLFVAADYFQLPVLKAVCEEELSTGIKVENAADVLQLAEKYDSDSLKKTAVEFIISHYKAVMNTTGWQDIPDNMTRHLLSTFLIIVAEK